MRTELATELIRSLPKSLRRNLVPAPEYAERALAWLADHPPDPAESLPDALGRALRALTGERVHIGDLDLEAVPDHLRMTFADVRTSEPGGPAARHRQGPDAARRALAAELSGRSRPRPPELRQTGRPHWDFGDHSPSGDEWPAMVIRWSATRRWSTRAAPSAACWRARPAAGHATAPGYAGWSAAETPDPTKWVVCHLANDGQTVPGHQPVRLRTRAARRRPAGLGGRADPSRRRRADEVRTEAASAGLCDTVRVENPT